MSQIVKYSHNFSVSVTTEQEYRMVCSFANTMAKYSTSWVPGRGRVRKLESLWTATVPSRKLYRFHINQYDSFIRHAQGLGCKTDTFQVTTEPMYVPETSSLKVLDTFTPYDYQVPYIEYLTSVGDKKVLTLQTGKGKSLTAMFGFEGIGTRTALIIPGKYVDKWIDDVSGTYGHKSKLMVCRGSRDLRALLELGSAGKVDADFIIITATTMLNYLKSYMKDNEFAYDVIPPEFFKTIGVGIRAFDEVHENLHLNYLIDLHTHVPNAVSLSATLEHDDPFINNIFKIMFPDGMRPPELAYDKYVHYNAVFYRLHEPGKAKYKSRKMYSHTVFEKYIMSNKRLQSNYLDMIARITKTTYVDIRKPKSKYLIYASTIEFCKIIKEQLEKLWPDLKIATKVTGDSSKVLEESDIIVSTLKSTGTAVDISGLIGVLMTTALNARGANIQAAGRLRKLKGEFADIKLNFWYLVCQDIDKHLEYHKKKREDVFAGKALTYAEKHTTFKI